MGSNTEEGRIALGKTWYLYDCHGRLSTYNNDQTGNLLAINYATNPGVTFSYNGMDRPVRMTDLSVQCIFN